MFHLRSFTSIPHAAAVLVGYHYTLATQHAFQNFKSYQGTQKGYQGLGPYGPWCSYVTAAETVLQTTAEEVRACLYSTAQEKIVGTRSLFASDRFITRVGER